MRRLQSIGIAAFMCFATSSALAQITIGPFPIDGLQPVPPTNSPGLGTGIVTLQPNGMLDFNIVFSGLLAPEVAAHFHGPAPIGINAGVLFGLPPGSPKIGSVGPLSATQQADLLAGLWYVNIHSSQFPGGEIRGQVIPAPGAVGLLAGFGLLAMGRRRR
ncbi:MAG: CHRD domain-containing protein [Planctomycetes bacterium]|nr:CHRD domain-containing protein [Planctomycetota bacterium]